MKFIFNLKSKRGFTLLELLVVVAIIGLLSSVVFSSLSSARVKAREAKRAQDMQTIYTMLAQYTDQYGHIPTTGAYGESETGGWDESYLPIGSPSYMSFLVTQGIAKQVPVDPINNSTYYYRYYCYGGIGLAIGYKTEKNGAWIYYPKFQDPGWTCAGTLP